MRRRQPPRVILAFLLAGALSLAALKYVPLPFVWIGAGWMVLSLVSMRMARRNTVVRPLLWNLAIVCFVLGAAESYAAVRASRDRRAGPRYPQGFFVRDDDLGRVPRSGVDARVWRPHGRAVAYDVTYSIDSSGLRRTPRAPATERRACILFFGGSFTFGDGLDDEHTLPFRVAQLSGGAASVYNFGFSGYGAHQMLAALETGRVASVVHCRPTHVVYQAVPDHVARAAGIRPWQRHDPRYRQASDGSVHRDGNFDDEPVVDPPSGLAGAIRGQLEKSALYRRLFVERVRRVTADDASLFAGVVSRARDLIRAAYPDCRFALLLWRRRRGGREEHGVFEMMLPMLQRAGFTPYLVDSLLPGYEQDPSRYEIPFDRHPNALADSLLAAFVLQSVVDPPEPD